MKLTPSVRGRREIPGLSDGEDQSIAMIALLASELAVARERIDTLERLLVSADLLESNAVEDFVPAEDVAAARQAVRQRLIAKIFQPLRDAARRAAEKGE